MNHYEEKILEDILRVSEECCDGEVPTVGQYRQYGDYGMTTIYRKLDSWTSAIEKLKMTPHRHRNIDREDIIEDLKRVSEMVEGSGIIMDKYTDVGKYGRGTCVREFGSWNNALEESGVGVVKNHNICKGDIIKEIKRISEEKLDGDVPTERDIEEYGKFSKRPILSKFGKFTNAQREAGFELERAAPGEGIDTDYGESWTVSLKRKVHKRDSWECAVCSEENICGWKPDIHHINPRKNWNVEQEHEEMNSLDNLVCLCRGCHGKFEGKWAGLSVNEFVDKCKEEY